MIRIASLLKKRWRMIVASAAVMVVAAVAGGVWYYYVTVWRFYEPEQELITCDQTMPCVLEERDRLQGRWRRGPRGIDGEVIFINADTWKTETDGPWADVHHFRLDPRKHPKQLDLFARHGAVAKGIYELEGDTFRVYFLIAHRPTAMPVVDLADSHIEYGDYRVSVHVYKRVVETESLPVPTIR